VWETRDPDGRRIVLVEERWRHVVERHPDLTAQVDATLAAVRAPDVRVPGREEGEQWFFRQVSGRLPWLQVVVHYERGEGWITTAFRRKTLPTQ
jgi:hypothetical protein